jgi:transcriptional regulator GlxA family with amidase domain
MTSDRIGVGDLAAELGWSYRRLHTRFSRHVGSPKRAARLSRFRHAVHLLVDRPELPLATVAARCGYFDQAHMSNEVARMSGLTAAVLRSYGPGGLFVRLSRLFQDSKRSGS